MIVGTYFHGDDDSEIAWYQHDVSGRALSIIVERCNRLSRFAAFVILGTAHSNWGKTTEYDHRTLQMAHDLLAAAWRFRCSTRQIPLLRDESQKITGPEEQWLSWLRKEVESWVEQPGLVREFQLVLMNQNDPEGCEAERRLCCGILHRFEDVPWDKSMVALFGDEVT